MRSDRNKNWNKTVSKQLWHFLFQFCFSFISFVRTVSRWRNTRTSGWVARSTSCGSDHRVLVYDCDTVEQMLHLFHVRHRVTMKTGKNKRDTELLHH